MTVEMEELLERAAPRASAPVDLPALRRRGARRRVTSRLAAGTASLAVVGLVGAAAVSLAPRGQVAIGPAGPPGSPTSSGTVAAPKVAWPASGNFDPALVAVDVCADATDDDCPAADGGPVKAVTEVIERSSDAQVVKVSTPQELAAEAPSGDLPADELADELDTRIVVRVGDTTDPMALFLELLDVPGVLRVTVGTAEQGPQLFIEQPASSEPLSMAHPDTSLEAPVAGSDDIVHFQLGTDDHGQTCVASPYSKSCAAVTVAPGLHHAASGPASADQSDLLCAEAIAGYDIARVSMLLADGTELPTASAPLRSGLPGVRLWAGCWRTNDASTADAVTTIAYGTDGTELDRLAPGGEVGNPDSVETEAASDHR